MVKVKIPATSANIGSGFDSLGLAVTLYNYVFMDEFDGLQISSMDSVPIPCDETNLVYTTAKSLFELCGRPFYGLRIHQENNIPLARGLGSSSACIIGGLMGANELLGRPLSHNELINLAAKMEGHPDNSTPALVGGLVTAVLDGSGEVYYVKQVIKHDLRFATFIPDFELKTSTRRAAKGDPSQGRRVQLVPVGVDVRFSVQRQLSESEDSCPGYAAPALPPGADQGGGAGV